MLWYVVDDLDTKFCDDFKVQTSYSDIFIQNWNQITFWILHN